MVYAAAEAGALAHFALDLDRLDATADRVVETIRQDYPDLDIPFHSRWRHFDAGGVPRWRRLAARLVDLPPEEVARIRIDLAVTSVLLDAGAGDAWRYRENGASYARSEGLAVASFAMFAAGAFAADPGAPLRADAAALSAVRAADLARRFQVSEANPLVGLDGRAALLRRLGDALRAAPDLFGTPPRVGNLYDHLAGAAWAGAVPAAVVLGAVLRGLGPIWPGRLSLGGVNLGDVWRHPAVRADGPTDGLVPFHKLSQWLVYSLVEPLQAAGLRVTGLEELTGLPEYRNGGLLIDCGLLRPKAPDLLARAHPVDAEPVVEWRALTVALLDRLAERVRARLGLSAAELPLAKILQGGTWSAGRRIARERRPDGGPPLRIVSDGTVF